MTLAAHQKAVVELASINSRVGELLERLGKFSPHDGVDAAVAALGHVRGPLMRAHQALAGLPENYSPHASKVRTTDIKVGAIVAVRDAHRKKWEGTLSAEDMAHLEVVAVGASCGVQTRGGVRLLIPRGHLVTAEAPCVG